MRQVLAVLAVSAALLAGCGGSDGGGADAERPVLALDFTPNAVHAPIYAAKASGADLDVRVPASSSDSLRLLATKRADLAVLDIHDLGLARQRGEDLVAVAALVQRPLAAVIARDPVKRPRDLEGKRVGVTGLPSDEAVLRAVVEGDGGDYGSVRRITIGFSAVPSLISEKVSAATAFWNAEGVALRERGVQTREFRVDEFGAPRYPELVVVTTSKTLDERREMVADVVEALRAGAERAQADPVAAAREVARAAKSDEGLVRAELEALGDALDPSLALDPVALDGWAAFDARFGILEERPRVDEAFDFSFARR